MDLPDRATQGAIIERYARLVATCGAELGDRPLVLPNGDFFPDQFARDAASAEALVRRMMGHAGMDDVPLAVRVVAEDGPEAPHAGGCASGCQVPAAIAGSVPRLIDDGTSWTLNVPEFELEHPVVLTTMIARALGHVFLVETLPSGVRPEAPADLTADYASVALGLGPLLLEGAHIYTKSCGGPSVAQVTRASLPELALLSAVFIEVGGHSARAALRELSTTQRAVLDEAHAVVKSNARLTRLLRRDPARVVAGDYELEDAKPWLFRIFGKKADPDEMGPADLASRPRAAVSGGAAAATRRSDPAHEELRALVEEALEPTSAE